MQAETVDGGKIVSADSPQTVSVLNDIGQILSASLELKEVFSRIMQVISQKLQMHRGTMVLLDESTGRLRTEAALGLSNSPFLTLATVGFGGFGGLCGRFGVVAPAGDVIATTTAPATASELTAMVDPVLVRIARSSLMDGWTPCVVAPRATRTRLPDRVPVTPR